MVASRLHAFIRFVRRLKRNTENTITYLKFAFEGNKIERQTDLYHCRKPILLMHGLGATRRVFQVLENRLRQDGHSVITIHLGGVLDTFNTKAIDESAKFVSEKVERLFRKYKIKEKLTIIGHSKGGLIARYYIKKYGGDKYCHSLITLGTPHNGSPWAVIGYIPIFAFLSKSIRQMFPSSDFLRELNNTHWPKGVKAVSIYSKEDHFAIYPASVLETHNNPNVHNMEIPNQGHTDFLISKASYWAIKRALGIRIKKHL